MDRMEKGSWVHAFGIDEEGIQALQELQAGAETSVDDWLRQMVAAAGRFPDEEVALNALMESPEIINLARTHILARFRGTLGEFWDQTSQNLADGLNHADLEPWQYCAAIAAAHTSALDFYLQATEAQSPEARLRILATLERLMLLDLALLWQRNRDAHEQALQTTIGSLEATNSLVERQYQDLQSSFNLLIRQSSSRRALDMVIRATVSPGEPAVRTVDALRSVTEAKVLASVELWRVEDRSLALLGRYPAAAENEFTMETWAALAMDRRQEVVVPIDPPDSATTRSVSEPGTQGPFYFVGALPIMSEQVPVLVACVQGDDRTKWNTDLHQLLEQVGLLVDWMLRQTGS